MKPSEKLIQTIKDQQIQPAPRWRFTLKNSLIWLAFTLAVILGALAFSVILFAIQQTDFNVINHLTHSRLELLLGLLPFFWIILLVIFLWVAMYSIQYSRKGYKFTVAKLAGFSAALSILLGTFFFIGGGADQLEQAFAVNITQYESIQEKKIKMWSLPEEGFLSGEIEQTDIGSFQLRDFNGKLWTIHYENSFIPPVVLLERGEIVKIVGNLTEKNQFSATEIRPWGGPGARMGRGGRR